MFIILDSINKTRTERQLGQVYVRPVTDVQSKYFSARLNSLYKWGIFHEQILSILYSEL